MEKISNTLIKIGVVLCIMIGIGTSTKLKNLGKQLNSGEVLQNEAAEDIVMEGETKAVIERLYSFSEAYNSGNVADTLEFMMVLEGGAVEEVEEVSEILNWKVPSLFTKIYKLSMKLLSDEDVMSFYVEEAEVKEDRAMLSVIMRYRYYNGLYTEEIPMYYLFGKDSDEWRIWGMLPLTELENNAEMQQQLADFWEKGILT